MVEETQNNPKKDETLDGLRHPAEFEEFVEWVSLPEVLRMPKTQGELAVKFGLGEDTLSNWKGRACFWDLVKRKRETWGRERTPNVIMGLYRKAVKDGNAAESKLWLQYFENWTEKTETKIDTGESLLSDEKFKEIIQKYVRDNKQQSNDGAKSKSKPESKPEPAGGNDPQSKEGSPQGNIQNKN